MAMVPVVMLMLVGLLHTSALSSYPAPPFTPNPFMAFTRPYFMMQQQPVAQMQMPYMQQQQMPMQMPQMQMARLPQMMLQQPPLSLGLQNNVQLSAGNTAMDAECQMHGKFDKDKKICMCEMGYMGDACDCDHTFTCSSHGTCDKSGMCVCQKEYTGPFCSIFVGGSPEQQHMLEFIKAPPPEVKPAGPPAEVQATAAQGAAQNLATSPQLAENKPAAAPADSMTGEQMLIQAARPEYFSYEKESDLEDSFHQSRATQQMQVRRAADEAATMENAMRIAAEIGNMQAKKFESSLNNVTQDAQSTISLLKQELETEKDAWRADSKALVAAAVAQAEKKAALEEVQEQKQHDKDLKQVAEQASSAIAELSAKHNNDILSWEQRASNLVSTAVDQVSQKDSKQLLEARLKDMLIINKDQRDYHQLGVDAQQMLASAVQAAEAKAAQKLQEEQLIEEVQTKKSDQQMHQQQALYNRSIQQMQEQMKEMQQKLLEEQQKRQAAESKMVQQRQEMASEVEATKAGLKSKLEDAESNLRTVQQMSSTLVEQDRAALKGLQQNAERSVQAAVKSVSATATKELQGMQLKLQEAEEKYQEEKEEEDTMDSRLEAAEELLEAEHNKTLAMEAKLHQEEQELQQDHETAAVARQQYETAAKLAEQEMAVAKQQQQQAKMEEQVYRQQEVEMDQKIESVKAAEQRKRLTFEKMFSEKTKTRIRSAGRVG